MHIHVTISISEADGQALNGLRPWRNMHSRRWMVSGMPPHFQDVGDYANRVEALLVTDVVTEHAGIYWLAHLSNRHPTIEVRACYVQLQVSNAVVLAALIRGLVSAAIEHSPLSQRLDVSLWLAARFGLAGCPLDPYSGSPYRDRAVADRRYRRAL